VENKRGSDPLSRNGNDGRRGTRTTKEEEKGKPAFK